MPHIFDNIALHLLPTLKQAIETAYRADFCVGYFNLRGWKELDPLVEPWIGGEGNCVRLLVGMQRLPQEELRNFYRLSDSEEEIDNQTAIRLKQKLAEEFKTQLTIGVPTNADEQALHRLAAQLRSGKVVVKLFLRHPLHAKLYLLYRQDLFNPIIGFMGSSNLTLAGLSGQGELNIDVIESDSCQKLSNWFEDRWDDRFCMDISAELAQIIEESWARETLIPPYQIYVKMAYHLAQEARAGLNEFHIPGDFGNELFEFQTAAVKIAAHHLNKRGGVLIGDVVGLGKTLMATALARTFEDDQNLETLIICPKNLVKMWQGYRERYRMRARVLSISRVIEDLPNLPRYRLIILDESHNLRNREGKRYKMIQEYIQKNESRVILLSATPYNKTYLDLSNQLRLFVPEDQELGIRPERLLRDIGETEFIRAHQCSVRSLAAFEHSQYPDDWRELMRLYMVRRTRSFILQNYTEEDPETKRRYLLLADGQRSFFPTRIPKTVRFRIDETDSTDQYARLFSPEVVDAINQLLLPRYGMGNYVPTRLKVQPTEQERRTLQDLSRGGKRLMGFCRTNLFKRLESSGQVFLQSVERHILRNYIFLYALENGFPLPIGTQDLGLLDTRTNDEDVDRTDFMDDPNVDEALDEMFTEENPVVYHPNGGLRTEAQFRQRAAEVYQAYRQNYLARFKWLNAGLFNAHLAKDLRKDSESLLGVLQRCGQWDWRQDTKLQALLDLINHQHADQKVLVFTQFADTVRYLDNSFHGVGMSRFAGATGGSSDPTQLAWRFSPDSNSVRNQIRPEEELRILVATDVLSEGQNLQDGSIVINYDLPWAIVRLIQRAGRVDRIGQRAENILCYSFLPADGVERILRLRDRVRQRLKENAEVVGTDEAFFDDDGGLSTPSNQAVIDIYNEKAGILDGEEDTEVDLASYAYQIWKNAITHDPALQRIIPDLPPVSYATKAHLATSLSPDGALVYLRTGDGNDALAWVDEQGNSVTESQFDILRAAECAPDTPGLPRGPQHHELVKKAVEMVQTQERVTGGQLGRPSGARFRTYEKLKRFIDQNQGTLWITQELIKAVDEIYRFPLRETARDVLNRQLRSGISYHQLAELVVGLRAEDRLCIVEEETERRDPQIICSLGLAYPGGH
jgi:superfamily II DNA or RNA helicase